MDKPVHTEVREGFEIKLYLLPEFDELDWDFESEDDRLEVLRKINNGTYMWFCAKVTASREGVELAADYLGACCYGSVAEFIAPNGHYTDMCSTVIIEAKAVLTKLGVPQP